MSKEALQRWVDQVKSTSSATFRETTLNKNTHVINLSVSNVLKTLNEEIQKEDPELLRTLTQADLRIIALEYKRVATSSPGIKLVRGDTYSSNRYVNIKKALSNAGNAANKRIRTILNLREVDYIPILRDKPAVFDHRYPAGIVRSVHAFLTNNLDMNKVFAGLKKLPLIKAKEHQALENAIKAFLSVLKAYSKNLTDFTVLGLVVFGDLKGYTENELHGRLIVLIITGDMTKFIKRAIKSNNWAELKGSDSPVLIVKKKLLQTAKEGGAIVSLNIKINAKKSRAVTKLKTPKVSLETTQYAPVIGVLKLSKTSSISISAIAAYINERLPPQVRKNMGPGSLVNRTGRFSESARIASVETTAQGHLSLGYTYQRSPYDVFDPVLGAAPWNSNSGRDPKAIISKSIREIAAEMALGRFYVRRI